MPPPWGIVPSGFNRKRLPDIIADAEERARATFGPGVIVSPQSPMGQLIGLFSDLSRVIYEVAEDVYNSMDPDQAEDVNLERLAKLRLLSRTEDDTDVAFRTVITNQNRSSIDLRDIAAAVRSVPGVTYARAWENNLDVVDKNGLAPHSVAVAVVGGEDKDVAAVVRLYVVPGVGTSGNRVVEVVVDGYCRPVAFTRVEELLLTLRVEVQHVETWTACEPEGTDRIRETLHAYLLANPPINGEDITLHHIRSALSSMRTVEVVGLKLGAGFASLNPPYEMPFDRLATFALERIEVVYAS